MSAIWKFELKVVGMQSVSMPKGAVILNVATQFEVPCIWAIVEPSAEKEDRVFGLATTGARFAQGEFDTDKYIGTFMLHGGDFVGHLFEA